MPRSVLKTGRGGNGTTPAGNRLRKEVAGMEVIEQVEQTVRVIGGEELPVVITRRIGLCEYIGEDGKPFMADEATYMDFGPKLGIAKTYVLHPENPPTEAEREAGRERIREAAVRAMTEQGLWDGVGKSA